MKRQNINLGAGVLVLATAAAFVWSQSRSAAQSVNDFPVDIVAGEGLYQEYCAACHGVNLQGQGDWQSPGDDGRLPAPPHDETGHTWHHPDSLIFTYTKLGGKEVLAAQGIEFDSGMPGFTQQLSDEEIWNIIEYIKSTWPERIRTIQAGRTASDRASKGE